MKQTLIRALLFLLFYLLFRYLIHWGDPILCGFLLMYIFEPVVTNNIK